MVQLGPGESAGDYETAIAAAEVEDERCCAAEDGFPVDESGRWQAFDGGAGPLVGGQDTAGDGNAVVVVNGFKSQVSSFKLAGLRHVVRWGEY